MYVADGASVVFGRDALLIVVDELQVCTVGLDLQIERAGGLYGVNVAVHMALGDVFLAYAGIQIDAFYVVMPFSVYVGIA